MAERELPAKPKSLIREPDAVHGTDPVPKLQL